MLTYYTYIARVITRQISPESARPKVLKSEENQPLMHAQSPTVPITGGCLCGMVKFALKKTASAVICHCDLCRKAQGALFACNFPVPGDEFDYLAGEENVQVFRSSKGKVRAFCRDCGSPIYSKKNGSDTLRIRTGALDSTAGITVFAHIFATQTPSWSPILDNLPQHAAFEPERNT